MKTLEDNALKSVCVLPGNNQVQLRSNLNYYQVIVVVLLPCICIVLYNICKRAKVL